MWEKFVLIDIKKCSVQYLKSVLSPLDEFKDFVFWIRTADMSKQIYSSISYETIWQREENLVYEIPLLWLDYLSTNNKIDYMIQLQERPLANYLNYDKNLVFYQIQTPNDEVKYLHDRAFKCIDDSNENYIVGISHNILESIWSENIIIRPKIITSFERDPYKLFFKLIKKYFGIKLLVQISVNDKFDKEFKEFIKKEEQLNLSRRELESLYYICLGKTYKQVARVMSISPRTVETHIENIIRKTECKNKIEVVSKYSQYALNNFTIKK